MRRLVAAALAAALLLAIPLGVDARRAHPHALAVADTITVADSSFGGSAAIGYTLATVLGPTDLLEGYGSCQAVDGGWAQFVVLVDGAGTFSIGPTPSWSSGGAACNGSLVVYDWSAATLTLLASTTFTVSP